MDRDIFIFMDINKEGSEYTARALICHIYPSQRSYEVAPRSDSEESGSEFEEEVSIYFFSPLIKSSLSNVRMSHPHTGAHIYTHTHVSFFLSAKFPIRPLFSPFI